MACNGVYEGGGPRGWLCGVGGIDDDADVQRLNVRKALEPCTHVFNSRDKIKRCL